MRPFPTKAPTMVFRCTPEIVQKSDACTTSKCVIANTVAYRGGTRSIRVTAESITFNMIYEGHDVRLTYPTPTKISALVMQFDKTAATEGIEAARDNFPKDVKLTLHGRVGFIRPVEKRSKRAPYKTRRVAVCHSDGTVSGEVRPVASRKSTERYMGFAASTIAEYRKTQKQKTRNSSV